MDIDRESLASNYSHKKDDELLSLHASGTLTDQAYEILEAELERRGIPFPQRPDPLDMAVESKTDQRTSWKLNASILTVLIALSPLLAAALSQASAWINDYSTYGTELQKSVQERTIGAFDPRPENKLTGEREGSNNNVFFDQLAMNVSRPRVIPLMGFGLVYLLFGPALFGVFSAIPLIGPRMWLIGLPGFYIVCLLIFGTYIGWWGAEGAN